MKSLCAATRALGADGAGDGRGGVHILPHAMDSGFHMPEWRRSTSGGHPSGGQSTRAPLTCDLQYTRRAIGAGRLDEEPIHSGQGREARAG